MATDFTRSPSHSFQIQAELELLQFVLDNNLNEEVSYPWNPAEAEAYFTELEQRVAAEWLPEELTAQGQALANQLEQLWATVPQPTPLFSLQARLLQQFSTQVPQQVLESIAQRAQQMLTANLSLADRLVHCVEELVPGWGEDDLRVLARPFAFAMRSNETDPLEAALRSIRCKNWTELSSIDQVKLSLAVAQYAIAQLPTDPNLEP
jgi:hypothetical protein